MIFDQVFVLAYTCFVLKCSASEHFKEYWNLPLPNVDENIREFLGLFLGFPRKFELHLVKLSAMFYRFNDIKRKNNDRVLEIYNIFSHTYILFFSVLYQNTSMCWA